MSAGFDEQTKGIDAMETHPVPENSRTVGSVNGHSGDESRKAYPNGEKVVSNGQSNAQRKDSISTSIIELNEGYEKLLWEQYSRMPQLPDVSVSCIFAWTLLCKITCCSRFLSKI